MRDIRRKEKKEERRKREKKYVRSEGWGDLEERKVQEETKQ